VPDPHASRDLSAFDFGGEETKVWMPAEQWNLPLIRAVKQVLPPDTTMAFNREGDRVFFQVSLPADTHSIYQAAQRLLASS
jgi:hypothetical protein